MKLDIGICAITFVICNCCCSHRLVQLQPRKIEMLKKYQIFSSIGLCCHVNILGIFPILTSEKFKLFQQIASNLQLWFPTFPNIRQSGSFFYEISFPIPVKYKTFILVLDTDSGIRKQCMCGLYQLNLRDSFYWTAKKDRSLLKFLHRYCDSAVQRTKRPLRAEW